MRLRLPVFDPGGVPDESRGLIGCKVRSKPIAANGPDVLRRAASMVAGAVTPSQVLRKVVSYAGQHDPALALRCATLVASSAHSLSSNGCSIRTSEGAPTPG